MKANKIICLLGSLFLAVVFVSCKGQSPEGKAPAEPQTVTLEKAMPSSLKGKVAETLAGGGFSYILLDTGAEQVWVTVPETDVAVGEDIEFVMADSQKISNFHSKTLERTFDTLIIAAGIVGKEPKGSATPHGAAVGQTQAAGDDAAGSFAEALQAEGSNLANQMPGQPQVSAGSSKAIVPFAELHIEKAAGDNGYSVGDVYGKASELDGKMVLVKGQVMKVSPNIMGKNWLHLQDGTGDPQQNTHDLVVTTAEIPEMGEIVTVEGTLAANKDFGFGYKYSVIIEDATIIR